MIRSRSRLARHPWAIRAAGTATVAFFVLLVFRFWHPVFGFTEFLQLGASPENARIAAFRDRNVYVYPYPGSYDGVSYAQIAYHPLLGAPVKEGTIDNVSYRARRIIPSILAWAFAAGNPGWIVHVYSVVNVAAWLILAALLWRILQVYDGLGWLAWAGVLFSAGALASVRLALTDLVALTAVAGSMLAFEKGRQDWAAGWMAVAGLSRETSLLALPGLLGSAGGDARATRRPMAAVTWPKIRQGMLAIAPLAIWMGYIRWRIGPADQGWGNFSAPFSGIFEKWQSVLADVQANPDGALPWTTLLAVLGLTVQAASFAVTARRRSFSDPWWRIGAAYAAFMLVLGPAVWDGYPGAATRVLLPMGLAFNIFAYRRRAALVWLIAGNLTVPAGILCMKDIPPHPREIAAAHDNGVAYVVRIESGWNGIEDSLWHTRAWCSGIGAVGIETWPHDSRTFDLEFSTRSLSSRTVIIRQKNKILWRGTVGPVYERLDIPLETSDGRAVLDFSTDSPGVPEGEGDHLHFLAFNMRDPLLKVGSRKY